ncbi:MAG TPA: MATE family efflux transporter [Candidatus Eisenbergiella merdavium]|uniref:Probable multidrug resistance protein NorM n=1 Tax=Candidatus Eisenbergiella merdavium TaxID=2838551 RepID=A0A9D2SP47_9FIRM|nr:MATE family efflux transporter [Candidatus Eisenbergiella merdavium]
MKNEERVQDESFRGYALQENMWVVLLKTGTPLAFYQALNTLYKMLDSLMASHINAETVSTVAYLSQISITVSSVGMGLATGSSLKISEAYGAGNDKLVGERVGNLFALCGLLAAVLLLSIPFTPIILRVAGTPKDLIEMGSTYFSIEMAGIAITFFNNAYIAVERARGNTKRIFWLNMAVILIKLSLTACFIYLLQCGITMIALAGVLSQGFLMGMGLYYISKKGSVFRLSAERLRLKKETAVPLMKISLPVMAEKAAFSSGKVIVNAMCSVYGSLTVGALGICNNLTGIFSNAQSGYQEGCSAIISQNLGAGKPGRALEAFKKIFVINVIFGTLGLVISFASIETISYLYACSSEGLNVEFRAVILNIFRYDALGTIVPWGISASVMAFMYSLGKTGKILFINLCRLFLFRILFLRWLQRFTTLGSESVGIVMLASNTLTAVLACILSVSDIRTFCRKNNLTFIRRI